MCAVKYTGKKPGVSSSGRDTAKENSKKKESAVSRASSPPATPRRRRSRERGPSYDVMKTTAAVFAYMEQGFTVSEALAQPGMPGRTQLYAWFKADPALQKSFDEAQAVQEGVWADQVVTLVDDVKPGDKQVTEQLAGGKTVVTGVRMADRLNKAKAQADNRKWLLARRDPAKYAPQQIGISNNTNVTGKEVVYTVVNSPDLDEDAGRRTENGLTVEQRIRRNDTPDMSDWDDDAASLKERKAAADEQRIIEE
jgi:hypothetical protein